MLTTSSAQPPMPYNVPCPDFAASILDRSLQVDGVRKKRGVWNVPTSGLLSFVCLGRIADDTMNSKECLNSG